MESGSTGIVVANDSTKRETQEGLDNAFEEVCAQVQIRGKSLVEYVVIKHIGVVLHAQSEEEGAIEAATADIADGDGLQRVIAAAIEVWRKVHVDVALVARVSDRTAFDDGFDPVGLRLRRRVDATASGFGLRFGFVAVGQ